MNLALLIRGPIANTKYAVSKIAQVRKRNIWWFRYCLANFIPQMRLLELIHEQYHGEGLASYCLHPGSVVTEM